MCLLWDSILITAMDPEIFSVKQNDTHKKIWAKTECNREWCDILVK